MLSIQPSYQLVRISVNLLLLQPNHCALIYIVQCYLLVWRKWKLSNPPPLSFTCSPHSPLHNIISLSSVVFKAKYSGFIILCNIIWLLVNDRDLPIITSHPDLSVNVQLIVWISIWDYFCLSSKSFLLTKTLKHYFLAPILNAPYTTSP